MTKLHQFHDQYGQSPWLDNLTRSDVTGDHPVWRWSKPICSRPARPAREVMT
jgi:hypothetical protein